ncbi:hypothetical protein K400107F7_19510 [Agathobaculum massiliense]
MPLDFAMQNRLPVKVDALISKLYCNGLKTATRKSPPEEKFADCRLYRALGGTYNIPGYG